MIHKLAIQYKTLSGWVHSRPVEQILPTLALIVSLGELVLWIKDSNNFISSEFSAIQSLLSSRRTLHISILQKDLLEYYDQLLLWQNQVIIASWENWYFWLYMIHFMLSTMHRLYFLKSKWWMVNHKFCVKRHNAY